MKIWVVASLGLLGSEAAAQMTDVARGHMHLPTCGCWKKDVVAGAGVEEKAVPAVIIVDNQSSATKTTAEMVRVRPVMKLSRTGAHRHRIAVQTQTRASRAATRVRPDQQTPPVQAQSSQQPSNRPAAPPADPNLPKIEPAASSKVNLAGAAVGVTYSPYNADGSCQSADQINADFQRIAAQQSPQYSVVRLYGVDCNQVANALIAADKLGMKLFLGIFNLNNLTLELQTLVTSISASSRGWAAIDTISIGNELVNNGQANALQMLSALNTSRTFLRAVGYPGPVVTVDTFLAVQRNPSLCDSSDYCAINVHPFFDADTSADQAGTFVVRKVGDVRAALRNPRQRIMVTESGWPWQGDTNGMAVPGRDNQKVAVKSILDVFVGGNGGEVLLFTAFDDPWKKAERRTFYTEQFWGME